MDARRTSSATSITHRRIIDLGIPTVVALNMMDLVEKNGDKIDVDALAKRLGCPVVPTSALKGRGMEEVVKAAIEAGKGRAPPLRPPCASPTRWKRP
ncbi:MAG: FeoB small GTPase domain-containing protein [Adlercreutzia equolifaciens]